MIRSLIDSDQKPQFEDVMLLPQNIVCNAGVLSKLPWGANSPNPIGDRDMLFDIHLFAHSNDQGDKMQ